MLGTYAIITQREKRKKKKSPKRALPLIKITTYVVLMPLLMFRTDSAEKKVLFVV